MQKEKFYALKHFTKSNLKQSLRGVRSFWNEVKILQSIQHPNINKFYGIRETEDSIFIVLELLEEGELYKVL